MKRFARSGVLLAGVLLAAMASPAVSNPTPADACAGPTGPRIEGESFRYSAHRRPSPCPAALASLASAAPAAAGETVNGLRRAGWVVIEKHGRIERRPGLPPYEAMERAVHVTTFVMEKDGRRKVCTLAYDSQLDSFAEECRDAE